MSKPSIPKGTRDFGPQVMARRNWMFGILRDAFERFGFQGIETPAMENLSTLTGKYGEEGDQLIFKILNNGDFLAKADAKAIEEKDSKSLAFSISKKALRYDLTVPFARFVVMSRNELTFPFRRYAMGNVWRGDRPGKGRYQEFTQCDADIIGTDSLLCELELIELFNEALTKLEVPGFRILINDRRVLMGLAAAWGAGDRVQDLLIALDKLDKVGADGVDAELVQRGFGEDVRKGVAGLVAATMGADGELRLSAVADLLTDQGQDGIADLRWLIQAAARAGVPEDVLVFDPTLARGLDYYTGAIFEVRVDNSPVGSICGGGRYADLTGIFGWSGMSGVGISFGADRIYDVLEHFGRFPEDLAISSEVIVCRMDAGEEAIDYDLKALRLFRSAGVKCEMYPEAAKLKKQLKFASDRAIPFVVLAGDEERMASEVTLRDMTTGEQHRLSVEAAVARVRG